MERILEKLGMRTRLILSFGLVLLVAMLVSLVGWLRSDILHSALLLQSGLQ